MSTDVDIIRKRIAEGSETKILYINPHKMRKVWDECKEKGECSPELLHYFQLIAENFSKVFWYTNEIDRLATINHALAEAWINWKKFDPERTENIFAFFTTCIANWMRQYYNHLTKNKERHISLDVLLSSVKR